MDVTLNDRRLKERLYVTTWTLTERTIMYDHWLKRATIIDDFFQTLTIRPTKLTWLPCRTMNAWRNVDSTSH